VLVEVRPGWRIRRIGDEIEAAGLFVGKRFSIKLSKAEDVTGKYDEILSLLNAGAHPLTDFTGSAQPLLEALTECGAVRLRHAEKHITEDDRFDRQRRFFDQFSHAAANGDDFDANLRSSTVCFIGLGGIGSQLAVLFSRMGLRKVIAFDFDKVERSNLSRQIIFDDNDIGVPKVVAAIRHFQDDGSPTSCHFVNARISQSEEIMPFLGEVDLMINGYGYPSPETVRDTLCGEILEACEKTKTACLMFGGACIGPIVGSSNEYIRLMTTTTGRAFLKRAEIGPRLGPISPAFAPRVAIIGGVVAWEASRVLSKIKGHSLSDRVVFLDTIFYRHETYILAENDLI
jgi:hypothetical protein